MRSRIGQAGLSRAVLSVIVAIASMPLAFAADARVAPETLSNSVLGLIVPLIVIVLALAALWWVLRKRGTYGGVKGPARVVQILAVGPRERILLIDHHSRRLMVGVTATSIRLVAELDRGTDDVE